MVSSSASNESSRTLKNYVNLISYILNILITYGIGQAGWAGTPDNGTLSEKYQTIITPKGTAFSIWAVIFTFQAIFAILQMFPTWGGRPMVQKGVSYWYAVVCLFQCGWTFAFAYEVIALSLVFMVLLWISLMTLLISQYNVNKNDDNDSTTNNNTKQGLAEFWFLRFPFAVHGGWITAATALNIAVVTVDNQSSAATQLCVGIICLAVLHALSVWHLFGYAKPNYTIPAVLIWANGWIYAELQEPKQLILDTFDQSIIDGVAYAAFSVSMIILIQLAARVGYSFNQFCFDDKGDDEMMTSSDEEVAHK